MSGRQQTKIEDIAFPLKSGIVLAEKARKILLNKMKTPELTEAYMCISKALEAFRRADQNAPILEESIKRLERKVKDNGRRND